MVTFILLSVVMVVGALGVVTLRQPVHAALSLVGTLLTLAVTYVTLQAHFLAAVQVIVYAGAIMVLFLFVIMLLNIQGSPYEARLGWLRPAAYLVGLVAAASIVVTAFLNPSQLPSAGLMAAALGGGGAGPLGEVLFSQFVLAFQLVGVLLLTGIVGAVGLVQRKAEEGAQLVPARATMSTGAPSRGAVATLERDRAERGSERASAREASRKNVSRPPSSKRDDPKRSAPNPNDSPPRAPRRENPGDDLKRISGVGPKLERLLHKNGVTTFEQLARLGPAEIQALDDQLGFKGRITREEWQQQARRLADEK